MYRWNLLTILTVITLLPILYNISILYTFISYYKGPNKVISSISIKSYKALLNKA